MTRRDRKGRYALGPKSQALLAEQALLVQVRQALTAFGADVSEGFASEKYGVALVLKTYTPGLCNAIATTAILPFVGDRHFCVAAYEGHAGRISYSIAISPADHEFSQATPAAPSLGGPREVSA